MFRRIYSKIVPQYFCYNIASYNRKVNVINKRGSLLDMMMYDKHKKKKKLVSDGSAVNEHKSKGVLSEIRSPSRRQDTISKLFVQNISDVLSTGDLSIKTVGSGIEIVGVKVSVDYRLANVYWQIPPSEFHLADEIHSHLNEIAPLIRSELISRNLLGRVPQIFFVREMVNANIAEFEEALKKADFGPNPDAPPSYEEIITKNIYRFKSLDGDSVECEVNSEKIEEPNFTTDEIATVKVTISSPVKPPDMKSNVFGLDHENFLNKIKSAKKILSEPPTGTAVISAFTDDLFSKIPGSGFQGIENRDELLKQFCLNRKKLREKIRKTEKAPSVLPDVESTDYYVQDENYDDRDYIEEN